MEYQSLLTMDQLMTYVDKYAANVDAIYQHYHTGTIDTLYTTALDDIVTALMMIPINRLTSGLPPTEENDVVADAVEKIADLVATMCSKPPHMVHADILQAVQNFPASDVRQSTILRQANRLN